MGIFNWLFGSSKKYKYELVNFDDGNGGRGFVVLRVADKQKLQWRTLPRSDGLQAFNVATKHYPQTLQNKAFTAGKSLIMRREPDNEHDPNAVAIYDAGGKNLVGYLYKEDAAKVAKQMAKGRFVCLAMWETWAERSRIGLRVLVVDEEDVAQVKFPKLAEPLQLSTIG